MFLAYYNLECKHCSIGYVSPHQVELRQARSRGNPDRRELGVGLSAKHAAPHSAVTRKVRLAWLPWIKSDLVTVPYFLVTFMLTCRLSDAPGARVNGISRVWGVVQQQEVLIFSMTTGSHALVRDWFHMDRVTTFEDVCERAESLTMDQFAAFAQSYPSNDLTVVTIGAAPVGQ